MKRKDFVGHKTRKGYCKHCNYYGYYGIELSVFHLSWMHGVILKEWNIVVIAVILYIIMIKGVNYVIYAMIGLNILMLHGMIKTRGNNKD